MKNTFEFGKITSTIGYDGAPKVTFECPLIVVDKDNNRVYINSQCGMSHIYGFDGTISGPYRGCAEVDENNDVVINDFDLKKKTKI